MRRREFIAALGSAAAWPLVAGAQQRTMPVIGYMSAGSAEGLPWRTIKFRQGLNELGLVEGQNVVVERRFAEGHFERMPDFVAELVKLHANVLVSSTGVTSSMMAAAEGIPVVSTFGGDPVRSGLVASLNRPGGNLTGVALFAFSLGPKRLEVLREAVPKSHVIAVLINAENPDPDTKSDEAEVEIAARGVGQKLSLLTRVRSAPLSTSLNKRTLFSSWRTRFSPTEARSWLPWWNGIGYLRFMSGDKWSPLAV